MKKKGFLFTIITILVLAMALFGCSRGGNSSSAPSKTKSSGQTQQKSSDTNGKLNVQLSTATTTGVFYPLGASLAKMWNDKLSDVHVTSQASDGSVQNLNLMQKGKINMGFTTIGVLYEAYNGLGPFKGHPYKDVRILGGLYPSVGQVVTRKGIGVNSIADFKGKKIVPGAPGSSTKVLAERILAAYHITLKDVQPQYVGFTEGTNLMRNKQADGVFITAGVPTSAVVEMLSTAHGQLLNIGDSQIQSLTKKYPWLYKYQIPAGSYDGQKQAVTTVAQNIMLVVPKSMPEQKVYELTKTLWGNIAPIGNVVAAAKNSKLENATLGLAGVPLHPGAKKFYQEKGVLKGK